MLRNANASLASWNIVGPRSNCSIRSRYPLFSNFAVQYGTVGFYSCVSNNPLNVSLGAPNLWSITPPMLYYGGPATTASAAGGWSVGTQTSNNNVFISSVAASTSLVSAGCGSAGSANSAGLTTSGNSLWILVPALSCSTTCNTFGFSLASWGTIGSVSGSSSSSSGFCVVVIT